MHHNYQRHGNTAALEGTITWAHYQPRQKNPNLPPPENGPIHTECRILKHVVAYTAYA